ncbi:MAG TPA: ATP12 family protein [Sphingomonadaceae bacterium]|nr:ATP12 family protein [Sphingomonadaceae bacterium]
MKRFYKAVAVDPVDTGWRVTLDGRGIRTQRGAAQIVPSRALAEALAAEWAGQGEEIDTAAFRYRDLADYAIDVAAVDRAREVDSILRYGETDTLCYRAECDEPLFSRQEALWEPVLKRLEQVHKLRFERVSGVIHRSQPPETLAALKGLIETLDPFALAALRTLSSLAASLCVGLAALEEGADAEALWAVANAEEDWQAEQWGWEWTAEEKRARRLADFTTALDFARLARAG